MGSEPHNNVSVEQRVKVVQLITNLSRGGAQATVIGSSVDLPEHIQMTVLAGPDDFGEGSFWGDAKDQGIDVRQADHLHRRIHPISDIRFFVWLVRWLRRYRPDVLHTHSTKAGVLGRCAAWLTRTPAIHTVHGWSFSPHPTGLSLIHI